MQTTQVAKQQQRPCTQDTELGEQQDGGNQIVDGERGLIARDKGRNGRQWCACKRNRDREQDGGDPDDGQCRTTLAARLSR